MRANYLDLPLVNMQKLISGIKKQSRSSGRWLRWRGCRRLSKAIILRKLVAVFLLVSTLTPAMVSALGVGAADVQSRLGQPLQVSIPVFNIVNPDALEMTVTADMFGGDPEKTLRARLDRTNNQLAVKVFTEWPVMEPYVAFNLELRDGSVRQAKDFVLLLEFQPGNVTASDPLRVRQEQDVATPAPQNSVAVEQAYSGNTSTYSTATAAQSSNSASSNNSNTLMGPYDWASSGQIPESFGAVLDGQSLWRVARRINQAMGVSVEQMMVALYNANPDAFYSDSIDSLKAGSYLTIPGEQTVRSVSEREAMQIIEGLASPSSLQAPSSEPVAEVTELAVTAPKSEAVVEVEEINEPAVEASESTVVETLVEPVEEQLFVIGDSQDLAAVGAGSATPSVANPGQVNDQQSIIDSLSQTIGDLMRDNVDKEQRLQAMDERLKALETTLDNVGLAQADGQATPLAPIESESAGSRWWLWLLPVLGAIGIWLGLRARGNINAPQTELFVDRDDEVEQHSIHVVGDEMESQGFEEYYSDTDFSVMRSQRSQNPAEEKDENDIEGVSYHEFEDEFVHRSAGASIGSEEEVDEPYETPVLEVSEEEAAELEVAEHTIEFDTSNVAEFPNSAKQSLDEALDTYLEEKDFTAAREALDDARGNELDEANYHFQRLRILLEKNDEHGFYEYFNLVENKFQDVDRDLQMDLANLVSKLNQR